MSYDENCDGQFNGCSGGRCGDCGRRGAENQQWTHVAIAYGPGNYWKSFVNGRCTREYRGHSEARTRPGHGFRMGGQVNGGESCMTCGVIVGCAGVDAR